LELNISLEEEKIFQFMLDSANTGYVNQHKLQSFLKTFGPMQSTHSNCIKNMRFIFREKWFYSFLSKTEAEFLLIGQPPGTFLLRFARSTSGVAVAFVGKERIYHILINCNQPHGFSVYEISTKTDKHYKTLQEIVHAYSYALVTPLVTLLPYEKWFQGDLTSQESNELLFGQEAGTFLLRFSSSFEGAYAVSVIDDGRKLRNLLIQKNEQGKWQLSSEKGPSYTSIEELINKNSGLLRKPLLNPANDIKDVVFKWTSESTEVDFMIDSIWKPFMKDE